MAHITQPHDLQLVKFGDTEDDRLKIARSVFREL